MKILFLDTEWSYAINYGFPSKKPQFNPAKNIKHRQFCVNASWKWDYQVSVQSVSVLSDKKQFKKDFRNDRIVAVTMHKILTECDVVVVHNAQFDLPMLNVLFSLYGLGDVPEKKVICTLSAARRRFRFAGNGLDDLLRLFGHEGKQDKPDWQLLSEGNIDQIKKSIKYCNRDVIGLETIFGHLRPYMRNLVKKRNKDALDHYGIEDCDACKSSLIINKGLSFDGKKTYPRVKCTECGHEMKGDIKLWKKKNSETKK